MKKRNTHFRKRHSPASGVFSLGPPDMTADKRHVTCDRCIRTKVYKGAK